MAAGGARYRYTPEGFVRCDADLSAHSAVSATEILAVADSWLVEEGRVRALTLHHDRFLSSAQKQGYHDREKLEKFWRAACDAIPPVERWFPRVELSNLSPQETALSLTVRIAPPLQKTARLRTYRGNDPRKFPALKGPDLLKLAELRAKEQHNGIDDLVIVSKKNEIIDGTATAILWWREKTLHLPAQELARVNSVTARSICVIAQTLQIPIIYERATPATLHGCEVWAVNALHGIRLVTEWQDGPDRLVIDPALSQLWQKKLSVLAHPLHDRG